MTHMLLKFTGCVCIEQHVTGSFDGFTSYQWLCVNFPWAGANRLNVTAPGKHKQAAVCRNATVRMQHGNGLVCGRCGGVMKKCAVQEADSCHLRVRQPEERAEEYLAGHAYSCSDVVLQETHIPYHQAARTPQGPSAFINGN